MTLNDDVLQEIQVLSLFNPASTMEGIKVHHSAEVDAVAATQRLYDKGLITLPDGGYLTSLGQDALRHLDVLQSILTTDNALPERSEL